MWYPVLPAMVPLAGALILLACSRNNTKAGVCFGITALTLGLTAVSLLPVYIFGGRMEFEITGGLTLLFKKDSLSIIFSALVSVMWLLAGIYSFEYLGEEHRTSYYIFYLLTEAALMSLAFSGNYLTMYMSFEFMSILSFPLILHNRTKEAVLAAQKYLFYSIFGASIGLIGFFFMAAYQTTTEFIPGGSLDMKLLGDNRWLFLGVIMMTIIGFGTKAGMFPMHGWLPTAHPEAPAPASAVMSGVITKCGIIAVIRIVYFEAGADFLRGTFVQTAWMILAIITVFMGSMLAFKEKLFKKRLAYSSVSQVSYVMLGLSTMTVTGVTGALLHVIFHSVIKDALFLTAGSVIHETGLTNVPDLKGIGKKMPFTMWCFTIASLGLIGIPPTCGFVSKWYLAKGSLESGMGALGVIGPVVLLISAFLTAGYLLVISMRAFLPGNEEKSSEGSEEAVRCDPGPAMKIPMAVLAALTVLLGLFGGPVFRFINTAVSSWNI